MKTIKDYNLKNKKVIIRVDFNVPIKDGNIIDDTRIVESLETIKYAIDNQAKVILLSHLGRIKEKEDLVKNSLAPIAKRLSELLNKKVVFVSSLNFNTIKAEIAKLEAGDICLLQNTRFYDLDGKKESSNSIELASLYASLGDIFINDAFGTLHRAHASNVGIANILPNGIGFLIEKELKELAYLEHPKRNYTVILGGSKVSDKIRVIEELVKKCDNLLIGGAMAFTFLKAKGYNTGKSLVEDDYLDFCKKILTEYENKIILPVDVNTTKDIASDNAVYKNITKMDDDDIGLDLGPETVNLFIKILGSSKTVFWNGPLGYYEKELYQKATKDLLEYLVNSNITVVLGGGDIVAASSKLGYKDKVTLASTGGGATLEYLEGKELPGLKVIEEKE